jgi:hypothetical protein
MNGIVEIGTVVSFVLMAVFLVAGVALPFIAPERRVRR